MNRLSSPSQLVTAAVCGSVLLVSSASFAKTVELRQDTLQNNSDSAAVCGFNVGEKFAARFTPPAYPARLLKVRVLLAAVDLSTQECVAGEIDPQIEMPLEVFHYTSSAPGDSLGDFAGIAYSSDAVLNEVDVAASNMSIDDGAFFIAFTLAQSNASPVHDASNASIKDANYIYGDLGLGAKWYSFQDLAGYGADPKGNWVIRLDVSVPDEEPDAGTGGSGGDAGTTADGGAAGEGGTAGAGGSGGSSAAQCTRSEDCSGGQTCDTDLGVCVQITCSTTDDCSGGYTCRNNACHKLCKSVSDCSGGESCEEQDGVMACMPQQMSTQPGEDSSCAVSAGGSGARGGSAGWLIGLGLALSATLRRGRRL